MQFPSAMNKSLSAALVIIGTARGGAPLSLLLKCMLKCTAPLCSYPSFGLQKYSASITECQWVPFFHMEKLNATPLIHPHFHVRHHCVRVPLCCNLSQGNNTERDIGGKVQHLLLYHQQPPLTTQANIIK